MHSWLLGLAALLGAAEASPPVDGTLLFLENCSSLVERATHGQIGHAALVFCDAADCWVYEATPGKVRRVTFADYCAELARINQRRDQDEQIRVWQLQPKTAYTANETAKMRAYLDQQLGRRYSVRDYVKGSPSEGIHCAELASTTLNQSGRYAFENCYKLHPQALYTALLPTHAAPEELAISPPVVKESWCVRAQRRTAAWWNWCGWSCREAWAWCW
jgi:hypothetical protein